MDWRHWGVGISAFMVIGIVGERIYAETPASVIIAAIMLWGQCGLIALYSEKTNRIQTLEKALRKLGEDPQRIY
jgi:hypothetical protein